MTFRQLTLMLIIFFLIVPMQIKKPKDTSHYDEHDARLRVALSKIVLISNIVVIGFYLMACTLILVYRLLLN